VTKVSKRRRITLALARVFFVGSALVFGWWALGDEWPSILTALTEIMPWQWLLSLITVLAGLLLTSVVWISTMRLYGYEVPAQGGASAFFVGQIGKYIPGSVWSLAAQAQMSRRFGVPVRVAVATGLVFLYWNLASAALVGAAFGLAGAYDVAIPAWLVAGIGVLALVGMAPMIVIWLSQRLAGTRGLIELTRLRAVETASLMALVWALYGLAVVILLPAGSGLADLQAFAAAVGAFSAAYVLGVLVPLAPAGFGVREAIFIGLLTPSVGLSVSTAVALLTRLVHTSADFLLAGVAWVVDARHQ